MIKTSLKTKRLTCLISLAFASISLVYAEEKPNIVWIFSDDHAPNAIGAYGGRFEKENLTPHLDQLAKEGMVFDRAYVANSICAPSRVTLLTGKHSHLNGKYHNGDRFNHNQNQFQKVLQKNGYQTAMVGKIHLDGAMQGFDYWKCFQGKENMLIRILSQRMAKRSTKDIQRISLPTEPCAGLKMTVQTSHSC